jgi:hypothetical protein
MTAVLSVVLGNQYGVAWAAQPDATEILKRVTPDRWQYYFNNVLASDSRILGKLLEDKPSTNWISALNSLGAADAEVKSKGVAVLLSHTRGKDQEKVKRSAHKLVDEYYGKAA